VTIWLVKLLHFLGLTNLSDEQVAALSPPKPAQSGERSE